MGDAIRLFGTKGGVDRNGLINLQGTYRADTLVDVLEFLGRANDEINGLPRVEGTYEQEDAGGFLITCTYEGLTGEAAGSDPSDQLTEYELDGSMEKSPIQTHKNYEALKKAYGWDEENQRFPSKALGPAKSTGLAKTGGTGSDESPVAGEDSYFEFGAEYTVRYARKTIPPDVLQNIGTIHSPRGIESFQIPNPGGKRNFLKMAPRIVKRGNAVKIEEKSLLSGPRGWAKPVYDVGQLEDSVDS